MSAAIARWYTRGHCAVAVRGDGGWLLHAGDAYFFRGEMDLEHPRCTPGLLAFQRVAAIHDEKRREAQARLRALRRERGAEVTIFCAHDPVEFAAFDVGRPSAGASASAGAA